MATNIREGEPFIPHRMFLGLYVPVSLVGSNIISDKAKLCWAHLARRAGQNGKCMPSRKDISAALGISETHVKRLMAELERAGLIRRVPRRAESGRQQSNEIQFLWHSVLLPSLREGHSSVPLPKRTPSDPAEKPQHADNQLKNPIGFVKSVVKRYGAKTTPAAATSTSNDDYRCPKCNSKTRGEGAILLGDGKLIPCECASEEYIRRQTSRGIFHGIAATA